MCGHTASVTQVALKLGDAAPWCHAASVGADAKLVLWRSSRASSGDDGPWEARCSVAFALKHQPICVALASIAASGPAPGEGAGEMLMAAVGHVDARIRLYTFAADAPAAVSGEAADAATPQCVVEAHGDWVTCLDLCQVGAGGLYLASGSADAHIRVWSILPQAEAAAAAAADSHTNGKEGDASGAGSAPGGRPGEGEGEGSQDALLVRRPREAVDQTVKRHVVCVGQARMCLKLEAVLVGHEDRVHSVRWRAAPHAAHAGQAAHAASLSLLSASMDKTMQVWAPALDDGVWTSQVRVGDIGGQPGQLGYYGALFVTLGSGAQAGGAAGAGADAAWPAAQAAGGEVQGLLAHGHNGAFFAWRPRASALAAAHDAASDGPEEQGADAWRWDTHVTGAGHYAPVQDLSWEARGNYLITVSKDQTARVWAQWTEGPAARARTQAARAARLRWLGPGRGAARSATVTTCFGCYSEVARPQVHGFDLKCVAMVGALPHSYVSGADDEKVRPAPRAPRPAPCPLPIACDEWHVSERAGAAPLRRPLDLYRHAAAHGRRRCRPRPCRRLARQLCVAARARALQQAHGAGRRAVACAGG
jgi:elongator complex protein 2